MPELPEVETSAASSSRRSVGRTIEAAEVLDERWTRPEPPRAVERALAGPPDRPRSTGAAST